MSSAKIYDVVRIKELRKPIDFRPDGTSVRTPVLAMWRQLSRCTATLRAMSLSAAEKRG